MEFRLTYAGPLVAHRDDKRLPERSLHVHALRRIFHKQLKTLWSPVLAAMASHAEQHLDSSVVEVFRHDNFNWIPIVTEKSGLICKVWWIVRRFIWRRREFRSRERPASFWRC